MIEKVLKFSLCHPWRILLAILTIASFGVYSFLHLPIDAVPDITNNQVQINTLLRGFSPLQMEKQVTYVIEKGLAGIPGLQMTRSLSRNGFSQVTAIFEDSVDIYFARQQINERLSEVREHLPEGAELSMGPISTGLGEIYMWSVNFKHPEGKGAKIKEGLPGWQENAAYLTSEGLVLKTDIEKASYLRTVQDWIIKPQLKNIQGLADIDSIGGYVRQYHIESDIEKMAFLGLSFQNIIDAIRQNNLGVGPGYIENGGEAFLIKSDERLEYPEQIETIVVSNHEDTPIRIKDIAKVGIGKEMRTGSASKNGEEAVIGTALMLIGANSRIVSQAVDDKLREINKTLPPDIVAEPVLNRTKLVNATIQTVIKNLSEGAILVIAVLFAFLGHFRAALITACVIPLSMLMAGIGMTQSKISGNLMSLGAIDFGLIVDGAIIITENCLRRLAQKQHALGRLLNREERSQEVLTASQEMIQPSLYGQGIIITVYIPILALSGVEGKMFHPMAMTVIFALTSAFILSLIFIPSMIALFVNGPLQEKENFIVSKFKNPYQRLLTKILKIPLLMVLFSGILMTLSFILFFHLGQEFVPRLDEKDIAMHAIRIPSTSLSQSTEMQLTIERALTQLPEVAYVYSKTGTAEMASDPMPPNVSDTFIILKPRNEWPDPILKKSDLIQKIEEALTQLPGNHYEFTQPIEMRFNELISGVRSDLAIKVYGDDFESMRLTAQKITNVLNGIPGAADVKMSQTDGLPILDIKIDRKKISQFGLNVSEALEIVSIAMGGAKAGQIFEGDKRFDLIVTLPNEMRQNFATLQNLPIPLSSYKTSNRPYILFKEIAFLKTSEGLNEILRENGKRFISVEANVRGTDLGSFVTKTKAEIAEKISIPEGYWLSWGGQFENMMSARNRLLLVIPICFSIIFILLYSAFNSIKNALLVFTGVPFALTGGIFSLWLREMPFSMSAAVGFIALSGIAVLNGLVLVASIDLLRKEKEDLQEAIMQGALIRFRPVLMTALVASLGFIPMALSTATGAEVQKPLATVVIGGLISSTLLTLIVLPTLYQLFFRKKHSSFKLIRHLLKSNS